LRTPEMKMEELMETKGGSKIWKTISHNGYGTTVIHERHSMDDLAIESRAIIINTALREGKYIDVPKGLILPAFSLGDVPDYFNQSGRAFDTWKWLIMERC